MPREMVGVTVVIREVNRARIMVGRTFGVRIRES